jgi:putative addiction module component (TIGR02574 family)
MKHGELIDEVVSLPVEERARLVDTLLRSLNAPESAIDSAWMEVARRRLDELRSGRVEAVPGEVVFERIRQRFAK